MAEANEVQIPRVKLGNQGLEVSKLGFGCMSLSGGYNSPLSDDDGISVIKSSFSKGITFFDTADVYGPHSNEILLGKALKQLPREKIQIATKFGVQRMASPQMIVKGSPDYVRSCCEASLKRLDVEYIDLYYQHRVDTNVPIEETGTWHWNSSIQSCWSWFFWWQRSSGRCGCKQLLGPASSVPRRQFGEEQAPVQLALAWVLERGDDVVPIPGTTKIKNLDDNVNSLKVKFTEADLKEISDAVPIEGVAGSRCYQNTDHFQWKFANTPPKN